MTRDQWTDYQFYTQSIDLNSIMYVVSVHEVKSHDVNSQNVNLSSNLMPQLIDT